MSGLPSCLVFSRATNSREVRIVVVSWSCFRSGESERCPMRPFWVQAAWGPSPLQLTNNLLLCLCMLKIRVSSYISLKLHCEWCDAKQIIPGGEARWPLTFGYIKRWKTMLLLILSGWNDNCGKLSWNLWSDLLISWFLRFNCWR